MITADTIPLLKLFSFIKWKTLFLVAGVIVVANIARANSGAILHYLQIHGELDPLMVFATISFGGMVSFILGSSGKYAGICVALTLALGMKYFPIIFIVEYCAYLLSPTHKCLAISVSYFDTELAEFYKVIAMLVVLMLASGLLTFLMRY